MKDYLGIIEHPMIRNVNVAVDFVAATAEDIVVASVVTDALRSHVFSNNNCFQC